MDVCGGDAYLSVSYNVFLCVCDFATYCLNKKKFCVCFFKYLFTAALLSAMAHSLRESASPPSRLCSVLRFFDVSRVFCFVWCAPSVGEHAELSVFCFVFVFIYVFALCLRRRVHTPPDPLGLGPVTNPFLNRGGIDASSLRTSGCCAGGRTRPLILLPVDDGIPAAVADFALLPMASNSFP